MKVIQINCIGNRLIEHELIVNADAHLAEQMCSRLNANHKYEGEQFFETRKENHDRFHTTTGHRCNRS
jgi:hypothetical protein